MRCNLARSAAACALGSFLVASALAHDEDWRKLADREPAYQGPMVTGGDREGLVAAGAQFDSSNAALLSWMPLSSFPGGQATGNDCWGYVSPSGREYAIMGLEKGTAFVEVTTPAAPVLVEYIAGATSLWHDVKVIGEYAYGVSEGGLGIQVIDLSQIDSGTVTLVKNKTQAGHSSTHNIAANPDSGFLYLCGANISNGGLVAISTADPTNPTIAGAWTNRYVHDAQVVTYTEGAFAGKEIAFCFNGGFGVEIIDVTNKNNMVKIGGASYAGVAFTHQGWVSEDKQLLYVNDELDEGATVSVTTTRVFDISNPANPTFQGSFTTGLPAVDHNLYVHEGLIYEANYRSGLRVFDATSNPTNPTEIAWFDTYPGDDAGGFNGAWSVYPFFPSGTVIVSDIERGLFVLDINPKILTFAFPQGLPSLVEAGEAEQVMVLVNELNTTLDEDSVTLHASLDGSTQAIPMTPLGAGLYSADLPAASCGQEASFWISAWNAEGEEFTSPGGAPAEAYDLEIITEATVVVQDEFESNSGWVAGVAGDTASTGQWTRANPIGTEAQPEDDHTPGGTQCYFTGQGSFNGDLGENDVDGGKTTLLSPVIDLESADDAIISYWRWYSNDTGNQPSANIFVVDVSNNGGGTWTNVEVVGPGGSSTVGGWIQHEFNLSDFVAPSASVRLRFIAEDDPSDGEGSIVEAAIDDLTITAIGCDAPPPCAGDFNGDGSLSILDFIAFQAAFGAGDLAADANGDGTLSILDFIAFQADFSAGC